jgi:hypothetical protein
LHAGEFRARLAAGSSLDSLLVEAFAVVREAALRVLGLRHFDCQLVGALAAPAPARLLLPLWLLLAGGALRPQHTPGPCTS